MPGAVGLRRIVVSEIKTKNYGSCFTDAEGLGVFSNLGNDDQPIAKPEKREMVLPMWGVADLPQVALMSSRAGALLIWHYSCSRVSQGVAGNPVCRDWQQEQTRASLRRGF